MVFTTTPHSKEKSAVVCKTCVTEEPKQQLSCPETITTQVIPVQYCVSHCSFPAPHTSHLQRLLNKNQNSVSVFTYSTYLLWFYSEHRRLDG